MTARRELPPGLGREFGVREAREAGVTARRLDASDLSAPFRGVRVRRRDEPQLEFFAQRDRELVERCAAYLPVGPLDVAFSHTTAARLYGMPVPERLVTDNVEVVSGAQPPRRRGVIGRRWDGPAIRSVHGLPVVTPELAWLQLAPLVTLDELVVAGDYLVRRKRPLSNLEALRRMLDAERGRRGVAHARSAFRDVRAGTDSPPESMMRLAIVRAGHPEPVIGHRAHHDGAFIGTPDLAYPELRIAIEYQGSGHRDAREFENYIFRLELFHEARWRVIQVTHRLLGTPRWLPERVRQALAERGAFAKQQL